MFRFIKQQTLDDSGIAALTVIGIISLMTVVVLAGFALSRQSLTDTQRTSGSFQGFQAADAGAQAGVARIKDHGYQIEEFPMYPAALGGINATVTVEQIDTMNYVLTSVGVDKGGSGLPQTVRVNFKYADALKVWDKNLFPTAGFTKVGGGGSTANFWGPLYSVGTLTIKNINAGPGTPRTGLPPLRDMCFIRNGQLNAGVGSSLGPLDFYMNQAPRPVENGVNIGHVYQDCPVLTMPQLTLADAQTAYALAKAAGGGGTVPAAAVNPTVLKPTNATVFSFPAQIPAGNPNFKWDGTRMTVNGTVYIEGGVHFTQALKYTGKGTLWVNGPVTFDGGSLPEDPGLVRTNTPPYYTPMDATHALGIVTPGDITCDFKGAGQPKDYSDNPDIAGAFFCDGTFQITPSNGNSLNAKVKGSVFAAKGIIDGNNGHLATDPTLPTYLPPSLPAVAGIGGTPYTQGAWTRN